MLLDLVQADKGLDGQIMESVVWLSTMYQFLCMATVSCFPMSEKVVVMTKMLVYVCGARCDNS